MRASASRILVLLALFTFGLVGATAAQTTYPNVKLNGRLQEQFYYFDNSDYAPALGTTSNFFIRRARIEARGQISENVSVFIQPSFEGGRPLNATTTCTSSAVPPGGGTPTVTCSTTGRSGLRLRDAWIDVRFGPEGDKTAIYFRGGQEKRPYSRYELTSSVNLPSMERGAGQGLSPRASNDLFSAAGFLSHDVGASLRMERKLDDVRMLTLKVGAYNGQGESLNDVNGKKSFGARGTFGITSKLDVGASWFTHDAIVTTNGVPDSSFTNSAFGLDAQWGKVGEEGLWALAEYLQGDNAIATKPEMRGFQALAAYNIRMKSPTSWLYAIEPSIRVDVADPDTDVDDNGSTLITATLGFYASSRAQFRVGLESQSFQASGAKSITGIRSALTVNF